MCSGTVTNLTDFLCVVLSLINQALPVLFAMAVLAFFWGLMLYVFSLGGEGDEKKQKQGRSLMVWSFVAFVVMLSVFGLIAIIQNTFDLRNGAPLTPPEILKNR